MKGIGGAVLLFLVLSIASAQAQEWYSLQDGQIYVTDFLLQAGQSKRVDIASSQPAAIGFSTDVSGYAIHKELLDKYGPKIIEFKDINGGTVLSTVSGGSLQCEPVNGQIAVQINNLIDRDFKIVIYKKKIEERPKQLPPASPEEISKFFSEGEALFDKEGYIEDGGTYVKQPGSFCSVPIQGNKLGALFEMFMSKKCFNEKTFRNSPGIVIGCSVTNRDVLQKMYYGYNVAFYDENKALIGRAIKNDEVDESSSSVSSNHINLTEQEITRIKYYKIIFYESAKEIPETP